MTVGEAIKALDTFIVNREGMKKQLQEFSALKSDLGRQLAQGINEFIGNEIEALKAIKRQLLPAQKRTKIVCRHPKNMQDVCDGQKYCMDCNQDL